jgi:vacuolar-type H+-ATPase subunit C/Vma6
MGGGEIALVARAKGLAAHLVPRQALETLGTAENLGAFIRSLSHLRAAIEPIAEPADVFAVERAIGRTASRYLWTLYRWQERTPGVLDVFAAHQDRRSLRVLLRGAAAAVPTDARLGGLLPTPSLPLLALTELARQRSPADVVQQLILLGHSDGPRLLPLVQTSQLDLLAVDVALLEGLAERAIRVAQHADEALDEFVRVLIDAGNLQTALLIAGEPAEIDPSRLFVGGGRWLSASAARSIARAGSYQHALTIMVAAVAHSPLASALPVVASDLAHVDRTFIITMLEWLARVARVEPLGTAPLLRLLLLIEAQSRDLRALAWGTALATPPALRKQQLVTPA